VKQATEEEPIEQVLAERGAYLVEAEDVLLPSLEAKVGDVRAACQKAYEVLNRLQVCLTRQKRKK
jgi:hypothetical protein